VKPGKGSAFVRTSIRSLISGRVLQPTFKSGDKVGRPDIEEKEMQYLYKQGDDYYFMDNRTYEQTFLNEKLLGSQKAFLTENVNTSILFHNGKPLGISLPNSVDLKVVKCDPGVRGDTVSGAMKPAVLVTGYQVQVPLFINEGDVLKIDTRDGKYLTRVATAQ
jgi:elongation factor P